MAGLDFKRCTDLFLGSEGELARALGMDTKDLRRLREEPALASSEVLGKLGTILEERGRGMIRVGQMLVESELEGGSRTDGGAP